MVGSVFVLYHRFICVNNAHVTAYNAEVRVISTLWESGRVLYFPELGKLWKLYFGVLALHIGKQAREIMYVKYLLKYHGADCIWTIHLVDASRCQNTTGFIHKYAMFLLDYPIIL